MSLIDTSINLLKSLIQPQNLAANEVSSLLESIHGSLLAMQRREAELLSEQAIGTHKASQEITEQETDTLSLTNGDATEPSSITLSEISATKPDTDTNELASGSSAIGQSESQETSAKPDADTTELTSGTTAIGQPESQGVSGQPETDAASQPDIKEAAKPTATHGTGASKPLDERTVLMAELHAWMTRNKLTQVSVAAMLGTTQSYLSSILRHKNKPNLELVTRIKTLIQGEITLNGTAIAKPDTDTTELASGAPAIAQPKSQKTSGQPKSKEAAKPTATHDTGIIETLEQPSKSLDEHSALINEFQAWIRKNKFTIAHVAPKLKISRQHISGILRLRDKPSPELAIRIKTLIQSKTQLLDQSIKPLDDAAKSPLVEELRVWLHQNKLTQVSVATQLGISEMHMSNILRLKINPSPALATRIRDLINSYLPTSTTSQP